MPATPDILRVRDLRTYFHADDTLVRAVDGISFRVPAGRSVGLAGESGSGKTQTALSILGLVDTAPGIVSGEIWIDGANMLADLETYCTLTMDGAPVVQKAVARWQRLHEERLRGVRGRTVSMVFQEPKSSFIPYRTIRQQLHETLEAVQVASDDDAIHGLLERLQFAQPKRIANSYPHELSGGESQRAMLALALAGNPRLLIADEPTTLLDAITQRRILDLLAELVADTRVALLLITHNLAMMRVLVDEVVILFGGTVMETGPVAQVLQDAPDVGHPYTQELIRAIEPAADTTAAPLNTEKNLVGCRYYHRCRLKDTLPEAKRTQCFHEQPPVVAIAEGHHVACWPRIEALGRDERSDVGEED